MVEFVDQEERVFLSCFVIDAGVRYVEVEYRRHDVQDADDGQAPFRRRVDAGFEKREVEGQQVLRDVGRISMPPMSTPENDGADGQAFDPAIGDDEQAVRQVFGQDAVLAGE